MKKSILKQNAEIVPGALRARSEHVFLMQMELVRASRRFSLLQTLCARWYEKRTQQAELVGKITYFCLEGTIFKQNRWAQLGNHGHGLSMAMDSPWPWTNGKRHLPNQANP